MSPIWNLGELNGVLVEFASPETASRGLLSVPWLKSISRRSLLEPDLHGVQIHAINK